MIQKRLEKSGCFFGGKMKKRKYIAFLCIVLFLSFLLYGCTEKTEEKTLEEVHAPEPLVIETESQYRDKSARVQIYRDEGLMYEYDGVVEINQQNGKYYVIIHTASCSCFENGEVEDEERN